MNFMKALRKMANSSKWLSLYRYSKEIGNLKFFNNEQELTKLQMIFLNWIATYNSLYTDLASGEEFISEDVINDDLRAEAYLLYRSKKYQKKENKTTERNKNIFSNTGIPKIIFTKK